MTQAEKDAGRTCLYKPSSAELPFPRKEWKSACGFLYVSDYQVWDGTKIIKRNPSGKCMKCKLPIALDESEKDAEAAKWTEKIPPLDGKWYLYRWADDRAKEYHIKASGYSFKYASPEYNKGRIIEFRGPVESPKNWDEIAAKVAQPGDPLVESIMRTLDAGGWNRDLAGKVIAMVREHDTSRLRAENQELYRSLCSANTQIEQLEKQLGESKPQGASDV